MQPVAIQLLGGLRLHLPDRVVTRFRTQKTGGLLAHLAYHRGQRPSREVLIEMLWPDAELEAGRANLSTALSSLRSLLEPPGTLAGAVVVADRFAVGLNPDACTTDVARFEDALQRAARTRDSADRADALLRALDLYTGILLPDHYQDWIVPAQERLALRFRRAAVEVVGLLEAASDSDRAAEVALRTLSLHPLGDDPDNALRQAARRLEAGLAARSARLTPPPAPSPRRSALPEGTVTLLLVDTGGAPEPPAALRGELLRHGGRELPPAAGAVPFVFAAVGDALAGTLACQRALGREPLPDGADRARVRMALHTGDAQWRDDGSPGDVLHRAAQLVAAAHGGQTLCSEATHSLLVHDLEPGVRLGDLGLWRLDDARPPERLFQVDGPGGPTQGFPLPNAAPGVRSRLPLQFTRFIGREEEMARIVAILSESQVRLCTLTGPGGTGKTRLCLEAMGRFADTFPGAVWFVPLADLTDPSLLPQSILQAMGVVPLGGREPLEQAADALGGAPTVLILDNFEQLVEEGATIVLGLLQRVPTLRCVVTSRQPLGLPGEVEFPVPPLPTPNGVSLPEPLGLFESVRLFVDRAQAARPDFRITNANAPAVAELCDRLEGIPLAIELAAARAQVLSPGQMLAQLGNRFAFLVGRGRGRDHRHRSLRAAIDWSYQLLSPDLQGFFLRLSVFRGGWSLEAAETVCDEPLALDLLAQLRDHSLVATEDSGSGMRFRMLETLREYAATKLAPEEAVPLRERHAACVLAWAENAGPQLDGPQRRRWLPALDADRDNVRAALEWCASSDGDPGAGLRIAGAISPYWRARSQQSEGCRWLTTFLDLVPDRHSPATRGKALLGLGELAWSLDDLPGARAHLEAGLAVLHASGQRNADMASAHRCLGNLACIRCDYSTATEHYQRSIGIDRELGNRSAAAGTLANLANVPFDQGDLDTARAYFVESLAVHRELGDPGEIARCVRGLGEVEYYRGNYTAAREYLEEAREGGSKYADHLLAQVELADGNPSRACSLFRRYLAYAQTLNDQHNTVYPLEGIADVLTANGRGVIAARILSVTTRVRKEIGFLPGPIEVPFHERRIARLREALGDAAFDRAWDAGSLMSLDQAVELARDATNDLPD